MIAGVEEAVFFSLRIDPDKGQMKSGRNLNGI
jgi:hypothetical protein